MRLHRHHLSGLGTAPPGPPPAGYMWICGSNGCQLAPAGTQVYDSAGAAVAAGITDPFSSGTSMAYAITPNTAKNQYYDGPDNPANLVVNAPSPGTPAGPTQQQITAAASSPPVNATAPIPISNTIALPPGTTSTTGSTPTGSTGTGSGSGNGTTGGTDPTTSWLSGDDSTILLVAAAALAAIIFIPRLMK